MILLDEAREKFSKFLAEDPTARWRLDAALAHVITWAFNKGLEAGKDSQQSVIQKEDI